MTCRSKYESCCRHEGGTTDAVFCSGCTRMYRRVRLVPRPTPGVKPGTRRSWEGEEGGGDGSGG